MSVTAADLLRSLYRVRSFERAAGREPSSTSLIAATATALALEEDAPDLLTVCAASTGATLLRGLPARELALHQSSGDRDGHPSRPDLGLLAPVPSRGVSLSVAAGAALAFRLRGEGRVAVVVEDATVTQSGGWHEGLSLASARRIPLVTVLVRASGAVGGGAPRRKADAYGVHVERLVAEDADAVARRVGRIVASARAESSPWIVEIVGSERDAIARLETRVIVSEPEDPTSMSARDRLARWVAEADEEARVAWQGLEVAA